jgi:transposase-like protein
MDTSSQADATSRTDTQTISPHRRRYRTLEEKRQIVEKTLGKGASVARVAREHGVNANLVFNWRKLYQKGQLGRPTKLLPAHVEDPARAAKRRWSKETKQRIIAASLEPGACVREIANANGIAPAVLYQWRKRYRKKQRTAKKHTVALVPVKVTDAPTRNQEMGRPARAIEIELPKGRLRIIGADAGLLRAAMDLLQ